MKKTKIEQTVSVSIESLFKDEFNSYNYFLYIDHIIESNGNEYFDLYDIFGNLLCMDGEECIVKNISNGIVTLGNEYDTPATDFSITLNEFETATGTTIKA